MYHKLLLLITMLVIFLIFYIIDYFKLKRQQQTAIDSNFINIDIKTTRTMIVLISMLIFIIYIVYSLTLN